MHGPPQTRRDACRAPDRKHHDPCNIASPQATLIVAGMQMPREMGADFAAAFGKIFSAVAQKYDAKFVPFLLEGVGGRPEFNQGDQIHPNPDGHAILAENVWKVLRPLL